MTCRFGKEAHSISTALPVYNPIRMISGVVLAAGASSRMGQHKLLLPLAGQPLVRRVAGTILEAGVDEVLVVVGHEHARVVGALEGLNVRHVVNPDYASGMGSSFRAAVAALPDSEAALFALADQPLLAAADYRRVLDAYRSGLTSGPSQGSDPAVPSPGPSPGIVCVHYGEVTAPPHLFARRYFAELSGLEHGARPVLQRHASDTVIVQLAPELLLDIDTPDDYERARALLDRGR
jgi:molybdenum cofactor cytidylyltransferase